LKIEQFFFLKVDAIGSDGQGYRSGFIRLDVGNVGSIANYALHQLPTTMGWNARASPANSNGLLPLHIG